MPKCEDCFHDNEYGCSYLIDYGYGYKFGSKKGSHEACFEEKMHIDPEVVRQRRDHATKLRERG